MARTTATPPRWFALRELDGDTIEAGGFRVTPRSRVVTLALPFASFVWHHPTAVTVEREGRMTRLPIRDATRLAQLGLIGGGIVVALLGRMVAKMRKEHEP